MPTTFDGDVAGVFVHTGRRKSIRLIGTITPEMAARFAAVTNDPEFRARSGPFVVFLDSRGGDLRASIAMGRSLRASDGSTAFVLPQAACYNACVFVLAGAAQRYRLGSIGMHRPDGTTPPEQVGDTGQAAAELADLAHAYLKQLNIREALFDDMAGLQPGRTRVFGSKAEMDAYGLTESASPTVAAPAPRLLPRS